MARTKVKGGAKGEFLGFWRGQERSGRGGLEEERSSVFYWQVAGHRDTGWGCVGHSTEAPPPRLPKCSLQSAGRESRAGPEKALACEVSPGARREGECSTCNSPLDPFMRL